jgi:hypothetical protein
MDILYFYIGNKYSKIIVSFYFYVNSNNKFKDNMDKTGGFDEL